MIDSCLWTCFIWYLFATAGYHLDTLLDTLEEGRHSFLDFSTFPDLLKSSNPSLSVNQSLETSTFRGSVILPILVGSQCRYEGSDLSVYETGQRILECGGIPVYDMTQEV